MSHKYPFGMESRKIFVWPADSSRRGSALCFLVYYFSAIPEDFYCIFQKLRYTILLRRVFTGSAKGGSALLHPLSQNTIDSKRVHPSQVLYPKPWKYTNSHNEKYL
jgi:hypothetical protein